MKKEKQATAENKLRRTLRRDPVGDLNQPLVTNPNIFAFINLMTLHYLESRGRADAAREMVARFSLAFRQEAFKRFGHDTAETFLLAQLLKAPKEKSYKPRLDAISHIMKYKNKELRLSADEESAAEKIKEVWAAFSKGLISAGTNLEKQGGGSGRVRHPIDEMSDDFWRHYKDVYQIWYAAAVKIVVARISGQGAFTLPSIVFRILREDKYPEEIDYHFNLKKGEALLAFKKGLACYWEPHKLAQAFAPKPAPAPQIQSGTGKSEAGAIQGRKKEKIAPA